MFTEMHVPREERLYDLWDQHGDFRAAFVSWAEELTQGYDRYREVLAQHEVQAPPDDAAKVAIAAFSAKVQPITRTRQVWREAIEPYVEAGMTTREIAVHLGVELHKVGHAIFGSGASERLYDFEDEIRYGLIGPEQILSEARKRGIDPDRAAKGIAKRLGVTPEPLIFTPEVRAWLASQLLLGRGGKELRQECEARYPRVASASKDYWNEYCSKQRRRLGVSARAGVLSSA